MLSFQGDRLHARQRQNVAGLVQVTRAYYSDGKSGEKVLTQDDYTNARMTRLCAALRKATARRVSSVGRGVSRLPADLRMSCERFNQFPDRSLVIATVGATRAEFLYRSGYCAPVQLIRTEVDCPGS
jgi:hypothetical protein